MYCCEDEIIYEYRGKDYPCYGGKKGDVKMHKAMSRKERREWFNDEEIDKWKRATPKGEYQGSLS